jgi:uncharacterized protein YecA (UPF0149 family)
MAKSKRTNNSLIRLFKAARKALDALKRESSRQEEGYQSHYSEEIHELETALAPYEKLWEKELSDEK